MLSSTLFFISLVTASFTFKLPDYMKPCYRDDPKLNECVKKNLEQLAPKFFDGIAEFDLPPLDPFKFTMETFQFNQGNNLNGKLGVKTCTSNFNRGLNFVTVKTDLKNPRQFKMDIDFYVPAWDFEGEYEALGRLILYNVDGSGAYNISTRNLMSKWLLRGERAGEFMDIKVFTMRSQIEGVSLDATNLISGDSELHKRILKFINNNWEMLFKRLSPSFERAFDKTFRPFANRVFMKVPYDQLFPTGYKNLTSSSSTETPDSDVTTEASDLTDVVFTTTEGGGEDISDFKEDEEPTTKAN